MATRPRLLPGGIRSNARGNLTGAVPRAGGRPAGIRAQARITANPVGVRLGARQRRAQRGQIRRGTGGGG